MPVIHTFVAQEKSTMDDFFLWINDMGSGLPNGLYFCAFKIEEGNRATPWCPSADDIQEQFVQQESLIRQTAESIELKVKEIQVGGNNLQTNTDLSSGVFGYTLNKWDCEESGTSPAPNYANVPLKSVKVNTHGLGPYENAPLNCWKCVLPQQLVPGKIYTVSFWLASNLIDTTMHFEFDGGNGRFEAHSNAYWKYFSHTFVAEDKGNKKHAHIWVIPIEAEGFKMPDCFWICGYKLEEGNKATAWSPSPLDTKRQLLDTGIDIDSKTVTVTAESFKVQNNAGTGIAIFEIIDGKPVVKAQNINTRNLEIGKFRVAADTFSLSYSTVDSMDTEDATILLGNKLVQNNDWGGIDANILTTSNTAKQRLCVAAFVRGAGVAVYGSSDGWGPNLPAYGEKWAGFFSGSVKATGSVHAHQFVHIENGTPQAGITFGSQYNLDDVRLIVKGGIIVGLTNDSGEILIGTR